MTGFKHFSEIVAWQKARELVNCIYQATNNPAFSRDQPFKNQLRRAGVSAMTNIAEGYGRTGNKEFSRYLLIARASAMEVESLLYIAHDNKFVDEATFSSLSNLAQETVRLISKLRSSIGG
jgi:four helix bundle protein